MELVRCMSTFTYCTVSSHVIIHQFFKPLQIKAAWKHTDGMAPSAGFFVKLKAISFRRRYSLKRLLSLCQKQPSSIKAISNLFWNAFTPTWQSKFLSHFVAYCMNMNKGYCLNQRLALKVKLLKSLGTVTELLFNHVISGTLISDKVLCWWSVPDIPQNNSRKR